MKEAGTESSQMIALRRRAEELLPENLQALSNIPPEDIQQLIHELQVYQIELEIQNEELRRTQLQLAEARDKYLDLYDLAPIGYFTLDQNALVVEANLTAANLLDVERRDLINSSLTRFIAPDYQDRFYFHRRRLFESATRQTCELKLLKNDGTEFDGLLDSIAVPDAEGNVKQFRTAISDLTALRHAEMALCENEEKYRQLLNNESDAVMTFDAESLRFEEVNQAALDLYGYSKEEFLTLTVTDVSAEKEKTRLSVKKVKSGELGGNYVRLRYFKRKDGSVFAGEINAGNFISNGRKKIIGAVRDITERFNARENLEKSEARYRALSDATFEAIFISEEGVCLDANPAAVELFGYDYDELIGIYGTDVIAAESKELVQRNMLSGYEKPYEAIAQKKDGSKFHVEIRGRMMRYEDKDVRITVIRDINNKKQAEEALRQSEKRYRDLFNSIPIGLYRSTPEGSILDVNPAIVKILGYPDRDGLLQVKSLATYIDPDDRIRFQRLMEEQGFVHDFTVQLCRHDGSHTWVMINTSIAHDTESQMTYYEGAMADISDRKTSEEQIHKLSQRLIEAQEDERHMISRELHDTVAQDLSVAKMKCDLIYAELLNNQPPDAQRIQEICTALDKTISGVRNMAYDLRPPELEELGLVETIYQYCEDFTKVSGLPIDYQSAGLKHLKLDYAVQINLYRLVQEGLINVRKHAAADRVTLKLTAAYPNIILRVEDNGRGFDVQARAAAVDSEKRMGLRSMQERVALLNGKMKLQSKSGRGTKVTIKLPFMKEKNGIQENHHHR
jgi:PAS domain S-box-containing protein